MGADEVLEEFCDPWSKEGHSEWLGYQLETVESAFECLQCERIPVDQFLDLLRRAADEIVAYVGARYPHRGWPFDNWRQPNEHEWYDRGGWVGG